MDFKEKYEYLYNSTRVNPIKNFDELKNIFTQTTNSFFIDKCKKTNTMLKDIATNSGSIIEINNMFTTTKISTADIRETIKANLSNSYTFLDEALIKSLSGSITSLKTIKESEDYTCCVTGAFKTLEGYLTKVLVNKYSYKIDKKNKFSMFYKDRGN